MGWELLVGPRKELELHIHWWKSWRKWHLVDWGNKGLGRGAEAGSRSWMKFGFPCISEGTSRPGTRSLTHHEYLMMPSLFYYRNQWVWAADN